ncbi:MAG TPA: hypothetical protein VK192_01690 [Sphingomicrobium sp.]|nr:hypothetical protein [Sphingomicrobium sp.]
MARGFDSKFIEAQQEEAARKRTTGPGLSPVEQALESRRGTLQLARSRAAADLSKATVPAHRRMLEQAIVALDSQLAALDSGN